MMVLTRPRKSTAGHFVLWNLDWRVIDRNKGNAKRKKKNVSSNRQWTPLAALSVSSNTEELIMENGETGLIKKIERGECLRLLIEIRVEKVFQRRLKLCWDLSQLDFCAPGSMSSRGRVHC
jgi:hypothetical protein